MATDWSRLSGKNPRCPYGCPYLLRLDGTCPCCWVRFMGERVGGKIRITEVRVGDGSKCPHRERRESASRL